MYYNISDFGAKKETLCTESIQAAIDKCADNGGGVVVVPAGLYISGTIWLKSNVELHLQTGAILKASTNMDDYNEEDAYPQNWGGGRELWLGKHLIIAHECDNVAVTGNGKIDGSGDVFFGGERKYNNWYGWEGGYFTSKDENVLRPGQVACFIESTNVKLYDVSFVNAPCWVVFLHGCEEVQVRGVKISNPFDHVNTDGIDIDCCRNVTVSDCIISTGDDAVTVRCSSAKLINKKPSENITITNCVLASNSSVFRIGVGTGEIRHVRVSNIAVSRAGNLISYTTSYGGRGEAHIEDVCFSDISAHNVCRMLDCTVAIGSVKNVVMKNMNVKAKGGMWIIQKDEGCVSDITLKDIKLEIYDKRRAEDTCAIIVSDTENVTFDNVKAFINTPGWEKVIDSQKNKGMIQKDCNF